MRSYATHCLILALACICAACGGGGGGGDNGGGAGVVDTNQALALTAGNAVPVSGLVAGLAMGGITVGSLGFDVVASADSSGESDANFNILRVTQDAANRVLSMQMQQTPENHIHQRRTGTAECELFGRWNGRYQLE